MCCVGGNSADNISLEVDDGSGMRTSKSDTSLTDSFIIIPEPRKRPVNPHSALRPGEISSFYNDDKIKKYICFTFLSSGFKWQRQLVFRSKLTMHTAYDRKDNAEPASITALAVSRYVMYN